MIKRNIWSLVLVILIGGAEVLGLLACNQKRQDQPPASPKVQAATVKTEEKGHVPHHGGCLNAIETCEVGHAETKVEGDTLKLWFVGGGTETGRAVRVADPSVTLSVTTANHQQKTLTLQPQPNTLADEKVGDCSMFEAKAPWLAGLKEFKATGHVLFKGKQRPMVIEYPKGYDPD